MVLANATASQSNGWGFLVLLLGLFLLLVFFGWLPKRLKGRQHIEETQNWVPVTVSQPEASEAPAASTSADDEAVQMEITAAIAAVMAIYTQEKNGLNVRPMRRVGTNAPAWNVAGRRENR